MTKVNFISRAEAKELLKNWPSNTALISISDTHEEQAEMIGLNKQGKHALFVTFKDIDSPESGFNLDLARYMQDFIAESLKNKQNIIVHCFACVSRSGAIAKWINNHYALGNWYLDDYQGHNRYVYEIMDEAVGCRL